MIYKELFVMTALQIPLLISYLHISAAFESCFLLIIISSHPAIGRPIVHRRSTAADKCLQQYCPIQSFEKIWGARENLGG